MDTGIIFGQMVPIVLFCITTVMLIEAGNNVEEKHMCTLIGKYIRQT